jgi:hypothetical protein
MSYSSKYYTLDKNVLLNQEELNILKRNKIPEPKLIIPKPEDPNKKFEASNFFDKNCNFEENTGRFGKLNSCLNIKTENVYRNFKPSSYIDKISNNSFISHIYDRNINNNQINQIPYVDLHQNVKTQKGIYLLRNNVLNQIDDIAEFDEESLEDLYCKKKYKSKMELLDGYQKI